MIFEALIWASKPVILTNGENDENSSWCVEGSAGSRESGGEVGQDEDRGNSLRRSAFEPEPAAVPLRECPADVESQAQSSDVSLRGHETREGLEQS